MSQGPDQDRHVAAEVLRQSEERYRLLVEQVKDYAIFMLDPRGHVLTWNAGAERIKGYRAEEIIGQHFSIFYPAADIAADKPGHELRVASVVGRFEDEGWRLRMDGSRFWANVVITALRDEAGVLRGFGKVTRDLTERKRAEEQARELARAEAARAEAEAAGRRKDKFIALLAHELRNPLAPALTALTLLRQPGDEGERAEVLDIAERQVRHLKRLVDDLLDVAHFIRDRVELHRERLDLARLVRTAAGDRRFLLEGAGLILAVETPETPVWVRGDEVRLTQVLANLLDNARKFTPRVGSVTVRLVPDVERLEAVLSVRDTGAGIAPEMVPRLFETFSQADESLERSRGGLGLGLVLVKGIIEQHGGRVETASAGTGQGATFTVRLPLEAEPPALAAVPARAHGSARPLRVLVVEDNRDAAESLRLLLRILGHETRVACTGPDGLTEARAWGPDVVLSDIGLPGLNGLGLATELRKDARTAGALLVGISGYGSDDDRRRARQAGFDHYLVKPADPAAVEKLLAARVGSA